ncbi:hypothetical protein HPB51_000947 [Rhipicephalus microplus]|uniref:Uncharacterized protein n=1 Tax=Rhipicephalus microplus TaxID=6941 RepID=A0A9J6DKM0_RHIMP|nr:hypothetical protein HPB51_000947 [Rhipicephalus microplus]
MAPIEERRTRRKDEKEVRPRCVSVPRHGVNGTTRQLLRLFGRTKHGVYPHDFLRRVNEKSRPRGQASVAASTGSAQPRGSPVSPSREDVCSLRVKLRKQLTFAVDRARTAVYMQRRPARANRRTANQFGEPTRSGTPVAYKAFGSRLQQKPADGRAVTQEVARHEVRANQQVPGSKNFAEEVWVRERIKERI